MQVNKIHYRNVHIWIKSVKGSASKCTINPLHKKKFEWANISKEYKFLVEDWVELCKKCHVVFDQQNLTLHQLIEREGMKKKVISLIDEGKLDLSDYEIVVRKRKKKEYTLKRELLGERRKDYVKSMDFPREKW